MEAVGDVGVTEAKEMMNKFRNFQKWLAPSPPTAEQQQEFHKDVQASAVKIKKGFHNLQRWFTASPEGHSTDKPPSSKSAGAEPERLSKWLFGGPS
jgi:hypothetical protein